MNWKPIETAPRDGTVVLVFVPEVKQPCGYMDQRETMVVAFYEGGYEPRCWLEADGEGYHRYEATHWMPLPEPPE